MAASPESQNRERRTRKNPLSKEMQLPILAASARSISLKHQLALVTMRRGYGNADVRSCLHGCHGWRQGLPSVVGLRHRKLGLRGLPQSVARELGPKRIHVGHSSLTGQWKRKAVWLKLNGPTAYCLLTRSLNSTSTCCHIIDARSRTKLNCAPEWRHSKYGDFEPLLATATGRTSG